MSEYSEERAAKRQKTIDNNVDLPQSLTGSVSPPPLRRKRQVQIADQDNQSTTLESKIAKSPFQLTWIRDLPASSNVDAVTLKDILGDPLIAECWNFNYMHNVDFLMSQFDTDVKDLVKVHVVHGFWKLEDNSRLKIKEQASNYSNVTVHTAYMPEMFGTHHSKMLILIRHDATAQIVIHTANLIEFDWTNMTQAVWQSPLLPLITDDHKPVEVSTIGSGSKFKQDLLNYLRAYDTKRVVCKPLITQLIDYDFSSIRAALIASTPSRLDNDLNMETKWGWPALEKALSTIHCASNEPHIVAQMSSIATLGATDKWLTKTFFKTLSTTKSTNKTVKPKFNVVFPTPDEIRRSLNGYSSGAAVHVKLQSAQQMKQLQYMKPLFVHWAGDGHQHANDPHPTSLISPIPANSNSKSAEQTPLPATGDALRKRAAPHIKTYTRFSSSSYNTIDWALVTSANLSKQAWGDSVGSSGEVRVSSYEIGVLVWPSLWGKDAVMVPTFGSDTPVEGDVMNEAKNDKLGDDAEIGLKKSGKGCIVGVRMPYDLPLVPYGKGDEPWCATKSYAEPDWLGQSYNV